MTPNEYGQLALTKQADQEIIRIRVYTLGAKMTQLDNAARGIAEEAGECQAVVKRHLEYGKPLDRERGLDEAGDVLWRVNQYLDALGYTLEDAMAANLRKLNVRHDGGFSSHHAADENRDRAAEAAAVAARQEVARVAVQEGRRILQEQARGRVIADTRCTVAPAGWECSRTTGHDGPCAAHPVPPGGHRPEDPDVFACDECGIIHTPSPVCPGHGGGFKHDHGEPVG